jgi:hypothetical protein
MSELPEKKALRLALGELKSRSLSSLEMYNLTTKNFKELYESIITSFQKNAPKDPSKDTGPYNAMMTLLLLIGQSHNDLIWRSTETIGNLNSYVRVLENYSTELDNTLSKIIEDAIKQSAEQIEKQKELIGKKPEYTI